MLLLAKVVRTVAAVVVGIIVVAIVLVVLGANQSNDIVNWIHDAGSWLAGPFKGLFNFDDSKLDVAVNWGLAALVYGIVAGFVVRLLAGGDGYGARRPTVAP
jgi:glycerol uptake facilitator-like aquaporin